MKQATYLWVILASLDALLIPWPYFQAIVAASSLYMLWKTRLELL